MEVVSTVKQTEILKYTCFLVIPYTYSPMIALSPHTLMATMNTFSGTVFLSKRQTGLNFSFGAMSSPNIPDITFLLNKTFPSPTNELVLSSHRCSVKLNSYSTNMLKNYVINDNTRYSENLKSN